MSWPALPEGTEAGYEGAGKLDWLFRGDEQALHVWQGPVDEGQAVQLGVFVLRRAGASHHKVVRRVLKSARPYLRSLGSVAGALIAMRVGAGKTGSAAGAAVASWLVDALVGVAEDGDI
jgi:hypothetical protein